VDAIARWQRRLVALVPHAQVDDDSVLSVAKDFSPEVFAAGVDRHIGESDPSLWSRVPLKYLRKRCEWEEGDRAKKRPRTAPPSSLPPGAKPYTMDYDGPTVIGTLR
jgi:hypothetical protein